MEKQLTPRIQAQSKLRASGGRGLRATLWTIVASAALAAVKVLGGILGNSYALIADGIESLLDITSSLVVWGGLKMAVQPANERYPYGYGKAEPLSALVVATALLAAGAGIAIQSVREILTPHHAPETFTLFILVGVVIAKEVMFRLLSRTGKSIGSRAVQTEAWHHRSDSLTSLAAFVGISVALFGGEGYEGADDWAAMFAAGVIAFNGIRLFRSAWREVLDASPPRELIDRIRKTADGVDGVVMIEKCRVRRSGLGLFVDIHVEVDAELTVRQGHEIAHRVSDVLLGSGLGVLDSVVHIEPAGEESAPEALRPGSPARHCRGHR